MFTMREIKTVPFFNTMYFRSNSVSFLSNYADSLSMVTGWHQDNKGKKALLLLLLYVLLIPIGKPLHMVCKGIFSC